MAKAISYVIELDRQGAKTILEALLNPKPNKERDVTLERARKLNIEIR
ncbi:MAG: hypothetical protein WC492_04450 [Candidatus Micrarchaeia archaeon]